MTNHHLVLWVDAVPGADIIQIGGVFYDQFFVEEGRGWSSYVRPQRLEDVPMDTRRYFDIEDDSALSRRLIYWSYFPAVWAEFQRWVTTTLAAKSFEEASRQVIWVGLDMCQNLLDLADSLRRHELSFFADTPVATLSLTSAVRLHESVLAYVGFRQELGNTLESIASQLGVSTPALPDALRKCVAVGQSFHAIMKLQKRAYEKALAGYRPPR